MLTAKYCSSLGNEERCEGLWTEQDTQLQFFFLNERPPPPIVCYSSYV